MEKELRLWPRRLDLINSLPPGIQVKIANELNISRGYVSFVLNGYRSPYSENGIKIVALSEKYAAMQAADQVRVKFLLNQPIHKIRTELIELIKMARRNKNVSEKRLANQFIRKQTAERLEF